MSSYPASLQLALALGPYPLTDEMRARAKSVLLQPVDWSEFLFWLNRHGLVGLVFANMSALGEHHFPSEVFEQLKNLQRQASLRAMKSLSVAMQLKNLLERDGIDMLLLKGPLLSDQLYGTFNLRNSYDIDVLVAWPQFLAADALLQNAGYVRSEPAVQLSGLQARLHRQYRHHYGYRHPAKNISIEVHWSLAEPYYLTAEMSQQWMSRAILWQMPGLVVKTLAPEDLLAFLLLHGAKHRWSSLKQSLDLLAALQMQPTFDWDWVGRSLRQAGLERIAAQGLALLHALWGFEAPATLQNLIRADAASHFLSSYSLQAITWRQPEQRNHLNWYRYGFLLKPGLGYQAHYLSKFLAAPFLPKDK